MKPATSPGPTLHQVNNFVRDAVNASQPDYLVLAERKGTAVYRAVVDEFGADGLLPWDSVIASSAIPETSAERLRSSRILILDDLVGRGVGLKRLLTDLEMHGALAANRSNVSLAAFATHADCAVPEYCSISAHYAGVDTRTYRRIRHDLVRTLRTAGSLMLDTEHIELDLEVRTNITELMDALSVSGEVIPHADRSGRTNFTVFYSETSEQLPFPSAALPPGSSTLGVVRKVRVVQKAPNLFSVIPILLPYVPSGELDDWRPHPEDEAIFAGFEGANPDGRFARASIRASLEPLYWAIRDVYSHPGRPAEVHKPSDRRKGTPPSLEHLLALLPKLDVERLTLRVQDVVEEARSDGGSAATRTLNRKHRPPQAAIPRSPQELEICATELLCQLVRLVDEGQQSPSSVAAGQTLFDVMELGIGLGFEPARISAAVDLLIDESLIVTRVEEVATQLWGRSYQADGEVAIRMVRNLNSLGGPEAAREAAAL